MTRWREARGTQLKRQFENASLYVRELGDEQVERFGVGLSYLFNDWVERSGLGQGLRGSHPKTHGQGNEKRRAAPLRA